MRLAAALLFAALPAQAQVPAWCPYVNKETPLYRQYCIPPAPASLVCEGRLVESVEFRGMCAGWVGYRRGDDLLVACPGRPVPAGYVRMTP